MSAAARPTPIHAGLGFIHRCKDCVIAETAKITMPIPISMALSCVANAVGREWLFTRAVASE